MGILDSTTQGHELNVTQSEAAAAVSQVLFEQAAKTNVVLVVRIQVFSNMHS